MSEDLGDETVVGSSQGACLRLYHLETIYVTYISQYLASM